MIEQPYCSPGISRERNSMGTLSPQGGAVSFDGDGSGTVTVHGMPRYGQTPEWIYALCRDRELSASGAVAYGWLMLRYSQMARVFPSHSMLAEELGCSVSTVRRLLRDLRTVGALTWAPRTRDDGSQTSNRYWLAWAGPGAFGPDAPVEEDKTGSDQGVPPLSKSEHPPCSKMNTPPCSKMNTHDTYRSRYIQKLEEQDPPPPSRSDLTKVTRASRGAATRPERKNPARKPTTPAVRPQRSQWDDAAWWVISQCPRLARSRSRFKAAAVLASWLGQYDGDDLDSAVRQVAGHARVLADDVAVSTAGRADWVLAQAVGAVEAEGVWTSERIRERALVALSA